MAEKPMSNFKTAVNELMNGKVRTDDDPQEQYSEEPGFEPSDYRPSPTVSYVPAVAENAPSVFASDLIIEGMVKSKSDIKLNGYIKGDVSCGGSIISTGTIDGNIDCTNVSLAGSTITGNINVRGAVNLDSNSSVTGDVIANSLTSDGKIKGNVVLKEFISLKPNASLHGNVKAKNIAIESGTTLVGNIEIKSAQTPDAAAQPVFQSAPSPSPAPAPSHSPAPSASQSTPSQSSASAPGAASMADLLARKDALKGSVAKKDEE